MHVCEISTGCTSSDDIPQLCICCMWREPSKHFPICGCTAVGSFVCERIMRSSS